MIYRSPFERLNFDFDPPLKQTADVVFESDVPNDEDHLGDLIDAAWDAMWEQNPQWKDSSCAVAGYGGWSSVLGGRKITEVVDDPELDFDLGTPGDSPIPRIAETFKKKGWEKEEFSMERDRSWRVTGFYKTYVKPAPKKPLTETDRKMSKMTDEILADIIIKERAEMTPEQIDRAGRKMRVISCVREEAEFVGGSGVAGTILRLEDVEITGRVNWEDRSIARRRLQYKPHADYPTEIYKYWEDPRLSS